MEGRKGRMEIGRVETNVDVPCPFDDVNHHRGVGCRSRSLG